MTKDVYGAYLGNDTIKTLATGNTPILEGALTRVPGLNLDIFVDDRLTAKSCIVGSSKFAAILGKGPVKVRTWDDGGMGATIYQMDVFRQVKAPIFKTSANLNMAAYQLTGVIS
jgi:hypothetical protein